MPVESTGLDIPKAYMLGGLAATGLGMLVLLLAVLGVFGGGDQDSVQNRVAAYTRKGSRKLAHQPEQTSQGVTAQAVGMAAKVVESNEELASKLEQRLEAAGVSLKPAEWLLTHVGIAFASGLLGLLFGSRQPLCCSSAWCSASISRGPSSASSAAGGSRRSSPSSRTRSS